MKRSERMEGVDNTNRKLYELRMGGKGGGRGAGRGE
jgi:hypothetical protein